MLCRFLSLAGTSNSTCVCFEVRDVEELLRFAPSTVCLWPSSPKNETVVLVRELECCVVEQIPGSRFWLDMSRGIFPGKNCSPGGAA